MAFDHGHTCISVFCIIDEGYFMGFISLDLNFGFLLEGFDLEVLLGVYVEVVD